MAWYCAVKLEMATALTAALLTEQLQSDDVPGRGDAQQKIEAQLRSRMGLDISVTDIPELCHFGLVDDSYTTFEWSEGGIITAWNTCKSIDFQLRAGNHRLVSHVPPRGAQEEVGLPRADGSARL